MSEKGAAVSEWSEGSPVGLAKGLPCEAVGLSEDAYYGGLLLQVVPPGFIALITTSHREG